MQRFPLAALPPRYSMWKAYWASNGCRQALRWSPPSRAFSGAALSRSLAVEVAADPLLRRNGATNFLPLFIRRRGGQVLGRGPDLQASHHALALAYQLLRADRGYGARSYCERPVATNHPCPNDFTLGFRLCASKLEVDCLARGSLPDQARMRWTAPGLDELRGVLPWDSRAIFGVRFDGHRANVGTRAIVRA